ncbi:MAG: ATP-binding protein [Nitrospiraceae bacterium]
MSSHDGPPTFHDDWYRRVVELSPDGILIVHDERIVRANPAALALLGATDIHQLLDRRIWDFLLPDHAQEDMQAYREAHARGAALAPVQRKLLRFDGTTVEVEVTGGPLAATASAPMHVVLRNIALQRQLEDQMRQAQKMEAVGKLAGGIAHDFNNMLTVINGHSALLLEDSRLEEADRHSIDQISQAGHRAAALTGQLLAFSRRQVLQPKVVDVCSVIRGMASMLRTLAGDNVELVIQPRDGLGRIKVDPGQLEQVLLNLAVNARDAMPDGGRIVVGADDVQVSEAQIRASRLETKPGPHVAVTVSDTGTGIDPAVLPHIFEPFYTTKPKGKGTGLGLSTVYGVVKQSGGAIDVKSERGRGTVFTIYLPHVGEALSQETASLPRMAELHGTEGILVVEDEPAVRALVVGTLRSLGYRVTEARDGIEALLQASHGNEPIDVLLTDIVMPQMGGRELAFHLTGRWPELRVMFMSGYTDDDVVRRGVGANDLEFLQKPFTPNTLANRIRRLLDAPVGVLPNVAIALSADEAA